MAVDRQAKPRDSTHVPSIRELIQAALDAGKTVRQLEADSGYRVRFQTFQNLSKHAPKEFPKHPETIAGMVAALNVSESTVVLAYATGLGIPVDAGSTFALRLPPGVDALDPSMQDAIIRVARAALQSGARRPVADSPVTEDQSEQFGWGRRRRGPGELPGEDRREDRQ